MTLSESQKKLIIWLVKSIPSDAFKIYWSSSVYEPTSINLLQNQQVPPYLTQAIIKTLSKKGLLELHISQSTGPTFETLMANPSNPQYVPTETWDVEIQPEARNLVANNFQQPEHPRIVRNWPYIHTGKLATLLNNSHGMEDLGSLCLDIGIERDHLKWDGVSNKTRANEIVEYCVKHKILLSLLVHLVKMRPNENWGQIIENNVEDY